MDDITIVAVVLAVGIVAFWAGKHYAQMRFLYNISQNPDRTMEMLRKIKEINDSEDDGLPYDAIEVITEQIGNVVYAYQKLDGQFLGQADSIHSAMQDAADRNPGKQFWHPEMIKDSQTT